MLRVFMAICILILPICANSAPYSREPEIKFGYETTDGAFLFRILRSNDIKLSAEDMTKRGVSADSFSMAAREIVLTCTGSCHCTNVYKEKLVVSSGHPGGAGLLGVFLVRDDSTHLVTTWQASSSYNVEIFGCDNGKILRMLSINSRTMPDIYSDDVGMPTIRYSSDYDHPEIRTTLHWDGGRYVGAKQK